MKKRTPINVGRPTGMSKEKQTNCEMILTWYEQGKKSIRQGCRDLKISTATFYKWDKEYNPNNKDKRKY